MKRLALATTLGLAVAGCAHSVPAAQRLQETEARCELVQMLLREPIPSQHIEEFVSEGRELPVPVMVFVRRPEEGVLERLFDGDAPECGGAQYHVVRQLGREGLVLYLQQTPDGYAYDARRAGPQELSMGGQPQGVIRRNAAGGWAAASD